MCCRCEHTLTNSVTEACALTTAARSFATASESLSELHLPHFAENLHAAVNCFSHAIRVSQSHLYSLISTPSLGVYYCQQLTVCLSVPLSVTLLQIAFSFFCFSMESSHFLAVISPCAPLQNVVLRFLI